MKNKISRLFRDTKSFEILMSEVQQNRILSGRILGEINLTQRVENIIQDIHRAEFKVFSQWGDDGIIDFLVNYLAIENKQFVEFGVENYTEANTKFLLMNRNWKGLIMDGSEENMLSVQNDALYWKYNITAKKAFVTAENINDLLKDAGFIGEIGLYHIDIDGNDYWVWKATEVIRPIIVIVEYNSVFGYEKPWTIPYSPNFIRSENHYSMLYYGSSLLSLFDLAIEKGYSFIGCNSNGNNAYFIRNDKLRELKPLAVEDGYVLSQFSESRDEQKNLTFLRGNERISALSGMKVFNTRSSKMEIIS